LHAGRVQHYGWRYDYTSKSVDSSMHLGDLPEFVFFMVERMCSGKDQNYRTVLLETPDQLIVNEYFPGQGIAPHVDNKQFADGIVSVSLGSDCVMEFTHVKTQTKIQLLLERRSLLLLTGESRYDWKHGINAVKTDTINGLKIHRQRRVSFTFRRVLRTNT